MPPVSPKSIQDARSRAGLTQAESAALLGVDRVSWARYESGARALSPALWRYFLHVAGMERIPWHARSSE